MIEPNNLYLGDCLTLMDELPAESIDLVLCDPPYGVLNKGNRAAQWDRCIDLDRLWQHYRRILRPNGAVVLFAQGMFTATLMQSNPKWWRYNLVWDKQRSTGFLNAHRMPLRCHEDICVFYRSQPTYNPQMVPCDDSQRSHSRGKSTSLKNSCYGEFKLKEESYGNFKFPKSILTFPKEHSKWTFFHPTQKPVELMRYLVRTYSNEGDTVLDNCMGSGSTLVAAAMELRRYIGMELREDYFEIAKTRIENIKTLH